MHNQKIMHVLSLLLPFLLVVLLPCGGSYGASDGNGQGRATWSVVTHVVLPAQEVARRGAGRAKADLVDPVAAKMGRAGMSVQVREGRGATGEAAYEVQASSSGTVEEFRRLIHHALKPEINVLGGVTEITIGSGGTQSLSSDVVVAANPSTGYGWTVAGASGFSQDAPSHFVMHTRGIGVPQHQVLHLRNARNGAAPIKLVYRRPWEKKDAAVRITLDLDALPARLDLSDPGVPAGPAALPETTAASTDYFPMVDAATLPSSWDWRTQGIVPPVRDQNPCGSCWAFGTVGVMESALRKSGTPDIDLSEQFLVSCNTAGYSCDGGLTAHRYHYDTLAGKQTAIGAVLEQDKPYTASNGTCTEAYPHPYRLSGWQFVTGTSESGVPTITQIKSAISTYGPVAATICAGDMFKDYTEGVFSTDESGECNGGINHMIILVGWNDNGGNGYWILRNSWGENWGMGGYMNIAYNTSRVGQGASWVTTPAAPPQFTVKPTPITVDVAQGGSGTTTVTSTVTGGFTGAVTLAATDLPVGVSADFTPKTVEAPGSGSSILTFTVGGSVPVGSYQVTITGTGGTFTDSATVTLNVMAANTLFDEGFEAEGWSSRPVSGTEAAWTMVGAASHSGVTPHGGTVMARFNSYDAVSGSARLSYAGGFAIPGSTGKVTLSYWMYHDTEYDAADQVLAQLSTDGSTWTNVGLPVLRYNGSTGWSRETVDLSTYKGQANVRLAFLGTSAYGNDIYLDDVSVQIVASGDLTVAASPATVTVARGGSVTTTVTTTVSGGLNDAVELSVTGLPGGVFAAFLPGTIAAPGAGSATLELKVSAVTTAGSYPVTVTGTGGGVTKSTTVTLEISQNPIFFSFVKDELPIMLTIAQEDKVSTTVTTLAHGLFNSAVALTVRDLPAGLTAAFNPSSIAAPGSGSSTLTFTAAVNAPIGTYDVSVLGTGGGAAEQMTMTLIVAAPSPPFFYVTSLQQSTSFETLNYLLSDGGSYLVYVTRGVQPGPVIFDRPLVLTLRGGYRDDTYSSVTGITVVEGPLLVRKGRVALDHFAVR